MNSLTFITSISEKQNLIKRMPEDCWGNIFSFLNHKESGECRLVCKEFNLIIEETPLDSLKSLIFHPKLLEIVSNQKRFSLTKSLTLPEHLLKPCQEMRILGEFMQAVERLPFLSSVSVPYHLNLEFQRFLEILNSNLKITSIVFTQKQALCFSGPNFFEIDKLNWNKIYDNLVLPLDNLFNLKHFPKNKNPNAKISARNLTIAVREDQFEYFMTNLINTNVLENLTVHIHAEKIYNVAFLDREWAVDPTSFKNQAFSNLKSLKICLEKRLDGVWTRVFNVLAKYPCHSTFLKIVGPFSISNEIPCSFLQSVRGLEWEKTSALPSLVSNQMLNSFCRFLSLNSLKFEAFCFEKNALLLKQNLPQLKVLEFKKIGS